MKKIKETEDGKKFEWIDCGHGSGFWSVIEDQDIAKERQPLACPACNSILYNWDSSYFNKWGVCCNCFIDYIETNSNFPNFGNDNRKRAEYIKEKHAQKNKKE